MEQSPKDSFHPLDPLSVAEINNTTKIVHKYMREKQGTILQQGYRFFRIYLHEPIKGDWDTDFGLTTFSTVTRQAWVGLMSLTTGFVYELIVCLKKQQVLSFEYIRGAHASLSGSDYVDTEKIVKESPAVQQALAKRGITNMNEVFVDLWTAGAGYFGEEKDDPKTRVGKPLLFVKSPGPLENIYNYARPISGFTPVVDLIHKKVLRIEEQGHIPIPPLAGPRTASDLPPTRQGVKPYKIVQPEGPSFKVNGWKIEWLNWHFRVGFNSREGLTLHHIGYYDRTEKKVRPIINRMSIAEMIVPYGDPSKPHYRRNAFDVGEEGLGFGVHSLKTGCDCLGVMHYFDVVLHTQEGEPLVVPGGICVHEEDVGVLYKHQDSRTGDIDIRRARRLALSFFATVANYDYGFCWYFYIDGTIKFEVKATGIISTSALPPGKVSKYRTTIDPGGLQAAIHQHFFTMRIDWCVDGKLNSLCEINTVAAGPRPSNLQGNAFYARVRKLTTEKEARRVVKERNGRFWRVYNPTKMNITNTPVSFDILPGKNTFVYAQPWSSLGRRAGCLQYHLWATRYKREERWPAGDYPNQSEGGEGLVRWVERNHNLELCNLVTWYTMGLLHIPRLEDWPIMPVVTINFELKPFGFFNENPTLDLPEPVCSGAGAASADTSETKSPSYSSKL